MSKHEERLVLWSLVLPGLVSHKADTFQHVSILNLSTNCRRIGGSKRVLTLECDENSRGVESFSPTLAMDQTGRPAIFFLVVSAYSLVRDEQASHERLSIIASQASSNLLCGKEVVLHIMSSKLLH